MTPLEIIEKTRQELQAQIKQREADLFAMQGALQILDEVEKEMRDEDQISDRL